MTFTRLSFGANRATAKSSISLPREDTARQLRLQLRVYLAVDVLEIESRRLIEYHARFLV